MIHCQAYLPHIEWSNKFKVMLVPHRGINLIKKRCMYTHMMWPFFLNCSDSRICKKDKKTHMSADLHKYCDKTFNWNNHSLKKVPKVNLLDNKYAFQDVCPPPPWMQSPGCTSLQWMHPSRQKTDGQQAVGTHPTGMHNCFKRFWYQTLFAQETAFQ